MAGFGPPFLNSGGLFGTDIAIYGLSGNPAKSGTINWKMRVITVLMMKERRL